MQLAGNPFDFVIAFAAGFLASLTPCVYPLIPVSAGYIVGNAQNSRKRALGLSLLYVTGMAITYSLLGILAVLTGSIFGKFSSAPLVSLVSGILILIFGIFMLDLFKISLGINFKPPVFRKVNFGAALSLGIISGLMITPCLTPILGSILAYLSTKDSFLYGGLLLFSFSYGMGIIFIIVGTFGAQLAGLPKSGAWMLGIKRVCASVMIATGLYFIFASLRRF